MENQSIFLIVIIMILLSCLLVTAGTSQNYHSWTKAIYNGKYIQDYLIECNGNELIKMSPIGDSIYVGDEWSKLPSNKLCEDGDEN